MNSALRRRGVSLIADWELEERIAGRHLKKILDLYRIDCVIDVGANMGQFRDFAVGAGWTGPIISFEPVESLFKALERRAKPPWRCYSSALGSVCGESEIAIFDSPGLASLRPADFSAMAELLPGGAPRQVATQKIQVVRLDQIFDTINAGSKVLLKTDTQGFDLEVFRGASGCLDRICALWVELSFLPIYRNAPSFVETLEEFGEAGFRVSDMFPVTHDKNLAAIEFDCALVRSAARP